MYNTEDSTLSNEDGVIDLPEWPLPVKVLHKRPQTALSAKQALRHRSPSILPNFQDTSDDLDNLDDLLQYIGHSSPECLSEPGRPLNAIISASHFLDPVMEKEMIAGNLLFGRIFEDLLNTYIFRRPWPKNFGARAHFQLARNSYLSFDETPFSQRFVRKRSSVPGMYMDLNNAFDQIQFSSYSKVVVSSANWDSSFGKSEPRFTW